MQISKHVTRVFDVVSKHGGWLTCHDIATKADVAERTARLHAKALADNALFEVEKVFGGYRYRIKVNLDAAGLACRANIEAAKRVFGES